MEYMLIAPLMMLLVVGFFDIFNIVATTVDATASMKYNISRVASEGCPQEGANAVANDLSNKSNKFFPIFKHEISARQLTSSASHDSKHGYVYWNKGQIAVDDGILRTGENLKSTTTRGAKGQTIKQDQLGQQICLAVDIPIQLLTKKMILNDGTFYVTKSVCALTETTNIKMSNCGIN